MAENLPSFLRREGDSLLFNNESGYFAFYVPELYFGKENIAMIMGDYINLIGILDYTIFNEDGSNIGLKPFKFPTIFLTQPGEVEKIKNVKLTKYTKEQDYRILKYYYGDTIVVSTKVPQDSQNIEEFFKLFLFGHLPTTVRYDEIQEYFLENIKLNGGKYSTVPTQTFGIIGSELCSDPNDLSKPFRLTDMKDMTGYTALNIRDKPKYVSPFTAIISDNFDEAVISAIEMKESKESPMEIILTR